MTLYQSKVQTVDRVTIAIKSVIEKRESSWTAKQRALLRERLQRKLATNSRQDDYVRRLLVECKRWGDPCSSLTSSLRRKTFYIGIVNCVPLVLRPHIRKTFH